jgi:hypothetical protein
VAVGGVAEECEALEGELVPNLLRLHMNSITVLHSDVEDYVTYDTLPQYLPGAPAVYHANDPHRVRAGDILRCCCCCCVLCVVCVVWVYCVVVSLGGGGLCVLVVCVCVCCA